MTNIVGKNNLIKTESEYLPVLLFQHELALRLNLDQ